MKEINDIKELHKAINKIKKSAGVKRGDLSIRTRDSYYGLSVNVVVKQNTPDTAAAVKKTVKEIVSLEHGDKEDDAMIDYFSGNHLIVYWSFETRELDGRRELDDWREWYVSDQDIETIEKVLKQKPNTIEKINDKTSASWSREPATETGLTSLTLYKTEGLKRIKTFTSIYYDEKKQIYTLAADLAKYEFIHEI